MFFPGRSVQVYLATGATDMRKSIDSLSVLVADRLDLDPFSGYLFCFCNRKKDMVKILYWDRNGFCLYAEFGIKAIMPMFRLCRTKFLDLITPSKHASVYIPSCSSIRHNSVFISSHPFTQNRREDSMSENSYYTRPWILNRYSIGPIAPHLTPFSEFLAKRDYSYATGQRYVREVGHLSRWLARQEVGIAELSEETIRTYLCFRYQNNHLQVKKWPYRHLLNYLQQTGIVGIKKPVETPPDQCIDRYQEHMVRNQGLEKETIRVRIRVARNFLSLQFGENSLEFADLLPRHIEQYLLNRSHHCNTTTLKTEASALRCFLRFLQFRGDISVRLADSVPTIPSWRHTTIPEFLTTDEINLLIQNCECETPRGQRNKAILLLLIRLGLRAIEICRLTLDDIDWDAGFLNILGKSGKRDRLPLLQDVGEAISTYLCHGRPQCSTRYVFVRAIAPFEPFSNSRSVANVVRNALRRANLNPPGKGTHLLRRSFATMLLQSGASLTEIGQILRHQKADTTAIYAKVDLGRLRPIARPWPEGGDQ